METREVPREQPGEVPLSERPLECIEHELESLAAQINAGSARWLELVAEFDRREGWGGSGCRSTAEWVAWRCGLTSRAAREHVRVARALPDLALIRDEFERGALSYSKVRALTRVADRESESDLVELARHATAAQLERMVRAARRCSAAEADEQHRDSYLYHFWDNSDGCLYVSAKLPPEEGALFLKALDAAREALADQRRAEVDERGSAEPPAAPEPGGSAEPQLASPPRQPSNAEALVAVAECALARPPTGLAGGERHQLLVHVDAQTLVADSPGASVLGPGACAVENGPGIAPETARRLACDASLVGVVSDRAGRPLSVGRRTRSIPPATRRALLARDGRCQFPGCERHRYVDAHHLVHWAHGGETALDNLILLCRHHHRLVHEGGFSVTRTTIGRLRWRRPDGRPIESSPAPPRLLRPSRALGDQPAGPLLTGTGEQADIHSCVQAVLAAIGMLRPTAPAARGAGAPT